MVNDVISNIQIKWYNSYLICPIVHDHTTLLLNNLNRGPDGDSNVIEDYSSLDNDQLRAWFLPEHGQHTFAGMFGSNVLD